MFEYICFFVLLFFAIFGFCEAAHFLKICVMFPKRKLNTKLIVKLDNNNAEKQLTFVGEQFLWLGNKYADSVLADNSLLDYDTYLRCKEIAQKYNILFP